MIVSVVLLLVSLGGVVLSMSSPVWSDAILIAGPCAVASIVILFSETRKWRTRQAASAGRLIVIDGSNVMYWRDGTPRVECVQDVVNHLKKQGFHLGVMFDANAGYLFSGEYRDDKAMSRLLNLPLENVMVVPKGTPADPYILNAARDMGAVILTNDRFRDWADDFPEVHRPGHLIKGEYRQGELWFDFATDEIAQQAA
ncbi:hypothetical protein [Sulfitobacter sp. CW3]|uniref:NYN domain-containing protein n=1 Tax=Sulfitobacter sp. CW3 TaxID=2861965 RepID=UPI001C5EAAFA|nr:hypothetical protein [Sulfitobacter sp. CW3]MBW4962707.1 hypothetical protein [Sulfitobacter sp. CW3]